MLVSGEQYGVVRQAFLGKARCLHLRRGEELIVRNHFPSKRQHPGERSHAHHRRAHQRPAGDAAQLVVHRPQKRRHNPAGEHVHHEQQLVVVVIIGLKDDEFADYPQGQRTQPEGTQALF